MEGWEGGGGAEGRNSSGSCYCGMQKEKQGTNTGEAASADPAEA